jgi:hypothetical protein
MSDTNQSIHDALTKGAARFEAAELALKSDVHTFMGKLKALYIRWYGDVRADIHDWHWQATALKNHIVVNGVPKHDDPATEPSNAPAQSVPTSSAVSDPRNVDDPSIHPGPGDPSFIRQKPDVTEPAAGGTTATPGSPAAHAT